MKTMLLAAVTAMSLGTIGSAYADGGDGVVANTQFTQIPGVVARVADRHLEITPQASLSAAVRQVGPGRLAELH